MPEDGGRRLRFEFRAGTRDEQVTIINAFLRASIYWNDIHGAALKCNEEWIRICENYILGIERRIKSTKNPQEVASLQEGIRYVRTKRILLCRAEIARLKQYAVIKWAK